MWKEIKLKMNYYQSPTWKTHCEQMRNKIVWNIEVLQILQS